MRTVKPAKLLRLHFGESDRHNGKPLYEAIVDRCRELGVAGATVFRGLEGFGDIGELHRRRGDHPIVVTIVDAPEAIDSLIPQLESMLSSGVIAVSNVVAVRVENTPPTS